MLELSDEDLELSDEDVVVASVAELLDAELVVLLEPVWLEVESGQGSLMYIR